MYRSICDVDKSKFTVPDTAQGVGNFIPFLFFLSNRVRIQALGLNFTISALVVEKNVHAVCAKKSR